MEYAKSGARQGIKEKRAKERGASRPWYLKL